MVTIDELNAKVAALEANLDANYVTAGDIDAEWLIICGALVFFMQLGFALLEAGTIRFKNVNNILFKNLMDASLGACIWFLLGYGAAYGDADDNSFVGAADFAIDDSHNHNSWFFQWAFAATAATIVSGSVAERTKIVAYFIYSVVITAFIYPVVVHWVWDSEGFMTAWEVEGDKMKEEYAAIDFAGSGVVHMVGGFAGLAGAIVVGPRSGFGNGSKGLSSYSAPLQVLGTMILWFGWYGFNCGSTLAVQGQMGVASRVATTTTLSAACGALVATFCSRLDSMRIGDANHWNLAVACNGILAGLVSITAGCPVVTPAWSMVIGAIGGAIMFGTSKLLKLVNVDDPLDAFPVHGMCGAWGVLAVGIFARDAEVAIAYSQEMADHGNRFRNQLVEVLAIASWTFFTSLIMFVIIRVTIGIRISDEEEQLGLDKVEHGGSAVNVTSLTSTFAATAKKVEMGMNLSNNSADDNNVKKGDDVEKLESHSRIISGRSDSNL